MVVVVSNRIPITKGREEEFERRWKNRKWTIANHLGFIRTEVLKPVRADHYIVVTHWQTIKDFENWTNSDAFMESYANYPPRETFSGPSRLKIHEIIAER
jgi:heme oxygenase (mycobilin-producing)